MITMEWMLVVCCTLFTKAVSGSWNFAGINVAQDKFTEQSPGTWGVYTSDLAVDGNTNTNFNAGSCSHTGSAYNTSARWTVYFNVLYTLKGIRIFSRNTYEKRHKNFKVIGSPPNTIIYDDGTANPQLYLNTKIDITINSDSQFSSVTIEVPAHTDLSADNGQSILQLCEVLIYTENSDCPALNSDDALVITVRQGTGYWNAAKGLVSTWTVLDFACTGYYILVGNEAIMCSSGGSYNATIPACIEIQCSSPNRIINGYYTQLLKNRYSVGETVQWECSQGYTSEKNRTRQCLVSTYWTGAQPTCTRITCSFPGPLSNGDLKFNINNDCTSGKVGNGTTISVICEEGSRANVLEIKCKDDGQWDNLALCIPVQCNRIKTLTGGYYNYMINGTSERNDKHVYGYGTVATAVCNATLYRRSTTSEVTRACGQNGYWTGHDELCDALCETPSLPNGKFSGQNEVKFYKAGHSLIPTCLDGFELDGDVQVSIRCQQNHTWYPAIPPCIEINVEVQQVSCTAGIAGGISGGIVLGAAIGIAVSCLVQRRKTKKGSPSTTVVQSSNPVVYSNVDNEHVYTELDRSAVR